jgi:hypothetical protein
VFHILIAEATQAATPLPVVALILMVIAIIMNIVGNIHRDVKTLVSGILYIVAGK